MLIKWAYFPLTVLVLLCSGAGTAFAQIRHLELGAANFRASDGQHPNRFSTLDHNVTELIAEFGTSGTVYLNDVFLDGLKMAADHLRAWLDDQGYDQIEVIALKGDYALIRLPPVKTANLANPAFFQLPGPATRAENRALVATLQNLAAASESGLKIITYYVYGNFDFVSWIPTYLGPGSTLTALKEEHPRYYSPDGSDPLQNSPYGNTVYAFRINTNQVYQPGREQPILYRPPHVDRSRRCSAGLTPASKREQEQERDQERE